MTKKLFTEYTSGNAIFKNMQKNGVLSKGVHFQKKFQKQNNIDHFA